MNPVMSMSDVLPSCIDADPALVVLDWSPDPPDAVIVIVPSELAEVVMPVSYTHLTLPTTPYV
mgnify:CR=1 FL=1